MRKSGGSHPSFDLRTSQGFAAGRFSGRLISTLRLRPDRTKQVLSGSFGVTTTTTAPPRPKVLVERVRLNYRVRALPGTLDAAFMGATGPFCTAVGSCGASGSLALALGRVPRTLTLEAFRPVPRRVGAARVIADLRRGLLGAPFGSLRAKAPGLSARVSETFVGADGSRCQASAVSHEAEIDFGGPAAPGALRGVPVALSESPDAGMWRTYCPGPDDSDMFGERSVVATASLRVPQLLRRHIVVVLANRGGFSAVGYAGSRSGDLALALTLVGVNAGVDRESL